VNFETIDFHTDGAGAFDGDLTPAHTPKSLVTVYWIYTAGPFPNAVRIVSYNDLCTACRAGSGVTDGAAVHGSKIYFVTTAGDPSTTYTLQVSYLY
jgi:hypothetical protein